MSSVSLCCRCAESAVAICARWRASRAEMRGGQAAVEQLFSASVGLTEPARTLGRGLGGSSGGGWRTSGRKPRLPVGERCPAGARASCGCRRRGGWAAPCVLAGSRQVLENAGLGLLWGWAKPGCVGVARVALARVFVGSAASHRRTAIQMYGVSCGLLPATTHPSRSPLSLA